MSLLSGIESFINRMINKIKIKLQVEDNKRLLSNFFSLSLLQGANYLLPLLTLPYLVRVLGVEYFGLLAFATSMIIYFKIITAYGFNLTATRDISLYRANKNKIIEIFSLVMTIKIILTFLSFLFLLIVVFSFEQFSKDWEVYLLTFGTVVGQVLFPVWFFQGMEQMKYITYLNILSKFIFTVAIFIFVQEENDFYIVPLLTSIGFIVAGIWSLFIIYREFGIKFQFQKFHNIKNYFKDGWNVFLIELLPNLYNNFSTFFLGLFVSMEMLGYYALAIKLIDVLNSFINVIRNVTYPYLVKNISKSKQITRLTISIGAVFTIATVTLSHVIIPFVFGETMEKSLVYLYMLSFSPLLLAITFSYGSNKLLILKKDKEMKNVTFQFSIFGFLLALILIPVYGAMGSVITLMSTRILMAILTYRKGRLL